MFLDEIHGGEWHKVRFQADVEHATALRDSSHARRRGKNNEQPGRDPGRRASRQPRCQSREGNRQRRSGQHGELGHKSNAQPAENSQRRTRQEHARGQEWRQPAMQEWQQTCQQQSRDQEEERPVERPLRVPVFLQRSQVRHAEVIRDVGQGAKSRGCREHERDHRQRHFRRPARLGPKPISPSPDRVQKEQRRREKETRVGVGPNESAGHKQPQQARLLGLGALDGQQHERQAQKRHQVRPLDETRLCCPCGEGQHQRGRSDRGPAPHSHAKEQRPCAQHENRLEQHGSWNPRRTMDQRKDDLEQPSQVDVRGVRIGEREQVFRRHAPAAEYHLAQAQIEKDVCLVHRNEATPSHEKQEQRDHARPSCPSRASAQQAKLGARQERADDEEASAQPTAPT
jgi:hypothetical protein